MQLLCPRVLPRQRGVDGRLDRGGGDVGEDADDALAADGAEREGEGVVAGEDGDLGARHLEERGMK